MSKEEEKVQAKGDKAGEEEEVDENVYNQGNQLMEESIEQEFQCLNP